MDWKLIWATYGAIFLAEMGDKTQLLVINSSAVSKRPFSVFLGGALALVTVTAVGAWAGGWIMKFVPEEVMKKLAAVVFVALGVWTWVKG